MKNTRYVRAGEFLRNARKKLGLSTPKMHKLIGIGSVMSLYQYETGVRRIAAHNLGRFAEIYEVDIRRLALLSDHTDPQLLKRIGDEKITVTTQDLEYLLTVSKGLNQPMNLGHMVQLLSLRQPEIAPAP